MLFRSIVPSPKGALSLHQALQLTKVFLQNAYNADDHDVALVLCHHAEATLSQAKGGAKKPSASSSSPEDQSIREDVATAYFNLGRLLDHYGHRDEAQAFYKKSEKWGGHNPDSVLPIKSSQPTTVSASIKNTSISTIDTPSAKPSLAASSSKRVQGMSVAMIPKTIFPKNINPPSLDFKPLEPDARLTDTVQLASCLGLLQASYGPEDILDSNARNWLQLVKNEPDEQDRLRTMATDVIRAFKRDEFKDSKAVTEVVYLSPILAKDDFRYLLKEFYSGIEQSTLLDVHQLEGLATLIQGADTSFLDADDLVKVLNLLSTRLRGTHGQSTHHRYQLTLAVSNVLDAMADVEVKGLDREKMHEPLLSYLDGLKGSSDPYLVYQAAYAYQALLCVPDNESLWQATLRRTGKVVKGVSGLVSAVKAFDVSGFIDGLGEIQRGLAGAAEVIRIVKDAYEGVSSLAQGGQGFLECLKEGLSFNRKCAWYPALRGADTMIQEGQLAEFRKLICEAPCRRDPAFQWGVCQRLGDLAANTVWDIETRRSAIMFLREIYCDDVQWGQQATVEQWILGILIQLSSTPEGEAIAAGTLLQDLQTNGDSSMKTMGKKEWRCLRSFIVAWWTH